MDGKAKKIFPGGNTSEGFYSYYSYLTEKGKNKLYILKGGPGVGKSGLMRKVGTKLESLGYDVEYYHCSSDSDSLDGIALAEEGIVMLDGTSPHMIDPRYPGATGETVNLGEYLLLDKVMEHKEQIIASTDEVSRCFARAYGFLRAAKEIAGNIENIYGLCMNWKIVDELTQALLRNFFGPQGKEKRGGQGRSEHFFGSAYTPKGYLDFTESLVQGVERIYYVEGEAGCGKTTLMEKIADEAVSRGFVAEVYHAPLVPQKIQTIVIPELSIAMTSSKSQKKNNLSVIDLKALMDSKRKTGYREELAQDKKILEQLLEQGIANIAAAKREHDILESYYIPFMAFEKVDQRCEQLVGNILEALSRKAIAVSGKRFH